MAFEDVYEGTEKIPLGLHDPNSGEEYWIEVKTCLSHAEAEQADKHLHKIRAVMDGKGKTQAVVNPDTDAHRRERVCASIVAWNLDEKDGSIWQLEPDSAKLRNVNRLPEKVFKKVLSRVDELNADDPGERADFREEAAGSGEDEHAGSDDDAEVSDGDDALEEAGNSW